MPFEELPHTADWCLRVWAHSLPALFAEAAHGMNVLSGAKLAKGPKVKRTFEAEAPDAESLLVAFLSELVYAAEQEHLTFTRFHPSLLSGQAVETFVSSNILNLRVEMEGGKIASLNKSIKAVTYHNLQITQTARGYEVEIVFDV